MNIQEKEYCEKSKEKSINASTEFIKVIMKKFPFKIECIHINNGFEFTNRLNWLSPNEKYLEYIQC